MPKVAAQSGLGRSWINLNFGHAQKWIAEEITMAAGRPYFFGDFGTIYLQSVLAQYSLQTTFSEVCGKA